MCFDSDGSNKKSKNSESFTTMSPPAGGSKYHEVHKFQYCNLRENFVFS